MSTNSGEKTLCVRRCFVAGSYERSLFVGQLRLTVKKKKTFKSIKVNVHVFRPLIFCDGNRRNTGRGATGVSCRFGEEAKANHLCVTFREVLGPEKSHPKQDFGILQRTRKRQK